MGKYTASDAIKKMVIISAKIEDYSQPASEQMLTCVEKFQNGDESYIQNYDNAISLMQGKNDVLASTLIRERDMMREAWSPLDFAKNVGKGLWDKGKEKAQQGISSVQQGVQQGVGALQQGVQKGVDAVREMGYKGVSQKMSQEVENALSQFEKSHLDVNILDQQINKIVANYSKISPKIPQTYKAEFDQYLKILQGLPDGVAKANQNAVNAMMQFVNQSRASLQALAKPMVEKEKASEAVSPAPAPESTSVAPAHAPAKKPSSTPNASAIDSILSKNPNATMADFMNTEEFTKLPPKAQEVVRNNSKEPINNLRKYLERNKLAFSKMDLVKLSEFYDEVGMGKEAETVLNMIKV